MARPGGDLAYVRVHLAWPPAIAALERIAEVVEAAREVHAHAAPAIEYPTAEQWARLSKALAAITPEQVDG